MSLIHLFYLSLFSVVSTASREKRLVLHSETDITQELIKLQTDFANFKTSVQTELHTELQVLKDELKLLKDELQHGKIYLAFQ